MTEDRLSRLRADAAGGDYPAMARLALALYEAGRTPREVMRECYGGHRDLGVQAWVVHRTRCHC